MAFQSLEIRPDVDVHSATRRIEFFSEDDGQAPHPAFGFARRVPRDVSKGTAARHLRSWLQLCDEAHAGCKSQLTKLPDRVLDISGQMARLIEFSDNDAPCGEYATMSHCWGDPDKSGPTTTTKGTLASRKAGIAPDDLSATFQDAIQLCKEAGCHYLWIDSLCIIQDDDSDWAVQSQKMAQIYSNAHFNIAATACRSSADRLFQSRWSFGTYDDRRHLQTHRLDSPSAPARPIFVRYAHTRDHKHIQGEWSYRRGNQAPLLDRAWVLQELLLARRTLYVCASELIWECKTLYDCECGSFDSHNSQRLVSQMPASPDTLPLGQIHRKQEFTWIQEKQCSTRAVHDFWLRVSQQYSYLRLARPSDRSAAFAGLTTAVQSVTGGTCAAGIWIEDLPRALIWSGVAGLSGKTWISSDVPSWSWMSRRLADGSCRSSYCNVLANGFRQEPRTSAATDATRLDTIIFEGPTIPADIQKGGNPSSIGAGRVEFYVQLGSGTPKSPDSCRFVMWADCPELLRDYASTGTRAECLVLGTNEKADSYYILVVSKCAGVDEDFYVRVGVSMFEKTRENQTQSYIDNAEIRTIKIM